MWSPVFSVTKSDCPKFGLEQQRQQCGEVAGAGAERVGSQDGSFAAPSVIATGIVAFEKEESTGTPCKFQASHASTTSLEAKASSVDEIVV